MNVKPRNVKNTIETKRRKRDSDVMTSEHNKKVLTWIEANRLRLGLSGAELVRRADMKENWYGEIKRKENARTVTHEEMLKLEKLFDTNFNKSEREMSLAKINERDRIVTFGGYIAAGYRGQIIVTCKQITEIPANPHPRFAEIEQEAWLIDDNSAEPLATRGAYVLVTDFSKMRTNPQAGDEVILKRYHPILFAQGDLSQAEHTLRIVERDRRGIVFRAPNTSLNMQDIVYDPDDKSVSVEKLIIGYVTYKT